VGELERVARATGAPVAVDLVPVIPLLVLVQRAAWCSAPDGRERPKVITPAVAPFDGAALVRRIHDGSILAGAVLGGYGVDLATRAAFTGAAGDASSPGSRRRCSAW
jgi:hypothetical protein